MRNMGIKISLFILACPVFAFGQIQKVSFGLLSQQKFALLNASKPELWFFYPGIYAGASIRTGHKSALSLEIEKTKLLCVPFVDDLGNQGNGLFSIVQIPVSYQYRLIKRNRAEYYGGIGACFTIPTSNRKIQSAQIFTSQLEGTNAYVVLRKGISIRTSIVAEISDKVGSRAIAYTIYGEWTTPYGIVEQKFVNPVYYTVTGFSFGFKLGVYLYTKNRRKM